MDLKPCVEENDGKKREKEVDEGGGKHHVQRVAGELLLRREMLQKKQIRRRKRTIDTIKTKKENAIKIKEKRLKLRKKIETTSLNGMLHHADSGNRFPSHSR